MIFLHNLSTAGSGIYLANEATGSYKQELWSYITLYCTVRGLPHSRKLVYTGSSCLMFGYRGLGSAPTPYACLPASLPADFRRFLSIFPVVLLTLSVFCYMYNISLILKS